jgi:hypothetical protein
MEDNCHGGYTVQVKSPRACIIETINNKQIVTCPDGLTTFCNESYICIFTLDSDGKIINIFNNSAFVDMASFANVLLSLID